MYHIKHKMKLRDQEHESFDRETNQRIRHHEMKLEDIKMS